MNESKASRTLLKSPPELWSEVSNATSLQRHMDQFGEIRITKLEPETAVAWEGEHARGTITLEGSGWGTRVSLTAEPVGTGGADEPLPQAADQPQDIDPVQKPRSGVADADPAGARAEPADDLAEAEPASARVEPRHGETPDPRRQTEAEMPQPTISLERDRAQASMQKPRWTQRLARAFMRWFNAAPQEDAHPVIQPRAPDPPTPFLAAPAPERDQTATFVIPEARAADPPPVVASTPQPGPVVASSPDPAPVVPEPERAATSPSPVLAAKRERRQEPPPPLENASPAALDAALDSLGQAHHRPFSRA